jgi:hypothetical protein
MVHCVGMKQVETLKDIYEVLPIIKVDYIQYWEAKDHQEIPFDQIRNTILDLARRFSVSVVSFDEWQSVDMAQSLRSKGLNVNKVTIRKPHYDTLATAIYDRRLRGYWNEFLVEEELLKLKIINNTRVDHGSKGFKDGSDALAGAVFQCMTYLDTEVEFEVEIWNHEDDYDDSEILQSIGVGPNISTKMEKSLKEMPEDIRDWLGEIL